MARDTAYDLAELALITALQAIERGAPIMILPGVLTARFQRDRLIALAGSPYADPLQLVGQTVGVRSYTQTTGVWVRAALWEDYGIAIDSIRWRTSESAHVDNYNDPPYVEADRSGKPLSDQLRDGTVAAAIMGSDLPESPEFVRVISDHAASDRRSWEVLGFIPPNHVLTASLAAVAGYPDAIREAYRLIRNAAEAARPASGPATTQFGIESMIAPLEYTIAEAIRQQLIQRKFSATELLEPAARLLEP